MTTYTAYQKAFYADTKKKLFCFIKSGMSYFLCCKRKGEK